MMNGHDGTLLEAYLRCEPTYSYIAANSWDQGLALLPFALGAGNDGLLRNVAVD